jgi:PAS domain-containing protein
MKVQEQTLSELTSELEALRVRNTALEAMAALSRSDQRSDAVQPLDASISLAMATDALGPLTLANQSFPDTLGYTTRELNSNTFMDIVHPESVPPAEASFQKAKAGQSVSHRPRGDEQLASLKAILDSTSDGVIVIDESGAIQLVNRTALDLFGYRREELVGQNVRMLRPAPHTEAHDGYLTRKDGSVLPMELRLGELQCGDSSTFMGTVQEIIERLKTRAEVARIGHELTQRIDTAHAPIFGVDTELLVTEWNQTAEAITGYTKAEVLGRDLVGRFITGEYQDSVRSVLADAIAGKQTANFEFPLSTNEWSG